MSCYVKNFAKPTIKKGGEIANILNPLGKVLGEITLGWVGRIYDDLSGAAVCNKEDILTYYLQNNLYKVDPHIFHPKKIIPGVALWPCFTQLPTAITTIANNAFNTHNGFSVVRRISNPRGYQFIAIGLNVSVSILDKLFNNMRIVEFFLNNVQKKLDGLFCSISCYNINLEELKGENFHTSTPIVNRESKIQQENFDAMLREAGLTHMLSGNYNFTNREKDCLSLLLEHKSNKAIANQLFLSHRTVEKYIESLKEKLRCYSRTELINKTPIAYSLIR